MTFSFPNRIRAIATNEQISYSVHRARAGDKKGRHVLLVGKTILDQLGWKAGDRVVAGFGDPGTDDYGWMLVRPDPKGVALRHSSKNTRSATVQISYVEDWISGVQHAAEVLASWRQQDGALLVKLPAWALMKPAIASIAEVRERVVSRGTEVKVAASVGRLIAAVIPVEGTPVPPVDEQRPRADARGGVAPPTLERAADEAAPIPVDDDEVDLTPAVEAHAEDEARERGLTDKQRAVLRVFRTAAVAGDWLSLNRIADRSGVAKGTIAYVLSGLIECGLLIKDRPGELPHLPGIAPVPQPHVATSSRPAAAPAVPVKFKDEVRIETPRRFTDYAPPRTEPAAPAAAAVGTPTKTCANPLCKKLFAKAANMSTAEWGDQHHCSRDCSAAMRKVSRGGAPTTLNGLVQYLRQTGETVNPIGKEFFVGSDGPLTAAELLDVANRKRAAMRQPAFALEGGR